MEITNKYFIWLTYTSITFERVPSDYAILKITHTPEDQTGGDTLWASGYEVYDRLSPAIQKLADNLTAVHYQVIIIFKHDLFPLLMLESPCSTISQRSMALSLLMVIVEPRRM
jgi:hypothetical protein